MKEKKVPAANPQRALIQKRKTCGLEDTRFSQNNSQWLATGSKLATSSIETAEDVTTTTAEAAAAAVAAAAALAGAAASTADKSASADVRLGVCWTAIVDGNDADFGMCATVCP